MIYEMHDQDFELMGLITTPLPEEIVQEIFDEYVKNNNDSNEFSLDDFVEIYRHEKNYDVDTFFVDRVIYPTIK
jgi:hypothetical protein